MFAVFALGVLCGAPGCGSSVDHTEIPEDIPIPVPPEDLKPLVDGNTQFAVDLYKKVAEEHDGNILISPYSISSALAMTYAGARGRTAEEMARTLHFTLPPDRLHPAFGGLTEWLGGGGKKRPYELSIANALWAQKGLELRPEFRDITGRCYGAGLREVDFAGDREAARGTINRWVEEQTRDKVKDLLQPNDLDASTRLVLSNAVYFRGDWKHPFEKARTHDADFEAAPGVKVKVPMMWHQKIQLRMFRSETWKMLELPYAGDQLAMVILLPVKQCGLREAEHRLSAGELEHDLAQLSPQYLFAALPRFQFRSRFSLRSALSDMGMPRVFTDAADFSGIASAGLRIKSVIHGGDIEVDETGTTASAVTHVSMVVSAPPEFQADHPFLFLIRDAKSGSILFAGRVANPR